MMKKLTEKICIFRALPSKIEILVDKKDCMGKAKSLEGGGINIKVIEILNSIFIF